MKKRLLKLLALIYILSIQYHVIAQPTKSELDFLMKLSLFQESSGTKYYISNIESLSNFMMLEFKMDTLEQKGFKDFIFLAIDPIYKNPKGVSLEEGPFLPSNCGEYIVAVHKNRRTIYRLKGFARNDFPSFIQVLKEMKYRNVDSANKIKRKFYVEKLDLACLYRASVRTSIDKKKYPCIVSCGDLISTH